MTTATQAQMDLIHRTFGGDPAFEQALCDYVRNRWACLIHQLPGAVLDKMAKEPHKVRAAVAKFKARND